MVRSVAEPEEMAAGRTLARCEICGCYTPHEWREGDGVIAKICVRCFDRAILDLLERD